MNIFCNTRFKASLYLALWVFCIVPINHAVAACSPHMGKVVINEVYVPNNPAISFIEIKLLDPSVLAATSNFQNWKIDMYSGSFASKTQADVSSVFSNLATNSCGQTSLWIRFPESVLSGLNGGVPPFNFVLYDSSGGGQIVDIMRLGNNVTSFYENAGNTQYTACTTIESQLPATGSANTQYDAQAGSGSSVKDWYRNPDGTGPWGGQGTSNPGNTSCGSNNGGTGTFGLAKVPSTTSVGVGSNFSYTMYAINGATAVASPASVVITDTLPAGVTFVSCTATPGTTSGTSSGPTGTCTHAAGVVTWTVGAMAANKNYIVTLTVQAASTGIKLNILNSNVGSPVATVTAAAVTVTSSAPGSFNAFETSTTANSITGRIFTKLAGTAFGLDVVAISGGTQNSFSGNVRVELLTNTGTSGLGYGADNCPTANSVIQTIASTAIASGRSTVNFSAVANAYQDVRVRISYPTSSPTVTSCSTDSFSIRPTAFTVTSTDATNTAATGTPAIKAGANFNLTATAVAGYGGTPLIDNTKIVGTTTAGTLAGSFAAASSATGIATGSTFTYSEVGNFGLNANAVYDSSFTSIDQTADCTADFSSTLVGGKYGCNIGSVAVPQTTGSSGFGRFIPDHFDTVVTGPMTCATGLTCPAGGLVYAGQAFTTQVIARNAAGATTVNYTGSYARAVTLSAWDAFGGAAANPGTGALTLNAVLATAFTAGSATTLTPVYTLGTLTTAPTDVYIRATESAGGDSVTSLRSPAATSVEGGVKVVNGRIKVSNAYGSELLPLRLTAAAQYYNGTGWATVNTDNASNLTLSASYNLLDKTGAVTGTTAASKSPASGLSAGILTITLAKPSAGATGIATISPGKPGYLQLVPGTGTFGVYSGNNNLIYQRESY